MRSSRCWSATAATRKCFLGYGCGLGLGRESALVALLERHRSYRWVLYSFRGLVKGTVAVLAGVQDAKACPLLARQELGRSWLSWDMLGPCRFVLSVFQSRAAHRYLVLTRAGIRLQPRVWRAWACRRRGPAGLVVAAARMWSSAGARAR